MDASVVSFSRYVGSALCSSCVSTMSWLFTAAFHSGWVRAAWYRLLELKPIVCIVRGMSHSLVLWLCAYPAAGD